MVTTVEQRIGTGPFVERMAVANAVIPLFAPTTRIEWRPGRGMFVLWKRFRPPLEIAKRWQTSGQDFYPVWHRDWGHGGTCATALSQIIRWTQGRPVLPLSTWRWWTGETVQLGRDRGPEIVQRLTAGGYPELVHCVLCGMPLVNGIDWWSLNGVSGPCCHAATGCRQRRLPPKG